MLIHRRIWLTPRSIAFAFALLAATGAARKSHGQRPRSVNEDLRISALTPGGAGFQIVRKATALADGRIVFFALVDGKWRLCWTVDASGRSLQSIEIPRFVPTSLAISGDTVAAMLRPGPQAAGMSAEVRSYVLGQSKAVRSINWPAERYEMSDLVHSTDGEFFVATTRGDPASPARYEFRLLRDGPQSQPLLQFTSSEAAITISVGRGGSRRVPAPWAGKVSFIASMGSLHVSMGDSVFTVTSSRQRTSYQIPFARTPFTAQTRDAWLAAWRTSGQGRQVPDSSAQKLRSLPLPAVRPAVRTLLPSTGGSLLIIRDDRDFGLTADSVHVVAVGADRKLTAELVLPPGTAVQSGGSRTIVASVRDEGRLIPGSEGRPVASVSIVRFRIPER